MGSISLIGGIAVLQKDSVSLSATAKKANKDNVIKGDNSTVDIGKGKRSINFDFYIVDELNKNAILKIIEEKREARFTCKFFGKFKASIDSYTITESDKSYGTIEVKLKLTIVERFGEEPNNIANVREKQRAVQQIIDKERPLFVAGYKNNIIEANTRLNDLLNERSNLIYYTIFTFSHLTRFSIKKPLFILDRILPVVGISNKERANNIMLMRFNNLVNLILLNGEINTALTEVTDKNELDEFVKRMNARIGAIVSIYRTVGDGEKFNIINSFWHELSIYAQQKQVKKYLPYRVKTERNLLNILTHLYGNIDDLTELKAFNNITDITHIEGNIIWIYA